VSPDTEDFEGMWVCSDSEISSSTDAGYTYTWYFSTVAIV
jgi:hypothetical protein